MLACAGCKEMDYPSLNAQDGENVNVTLTLRTGTNESATRMSAEEEKGIQNISVLVFQKETSGTTETERLFYQASATDVKPSGDGNYTTVVKLLKSQGDEKYSLMVIANCGDNVGLLFYNKTKAEVQAGLTFSTYTSIPMWGETDYLPINQSTTFTGNSKITLLRAVARVDAGLGFQKGTEGDGLQSESFQGIAGYALTDMRLYRTRSMGYVIPSPANCTTNRQSVNAATVPPTATIVHPAADGSTPDEGAVYAANSKGTVTGEAAGVIHSAYTFENNVGKEEETTVVVVGIKNLTDNRVGYYRMTLTDAAGKALAVLRNHRYIFNIEKILSRGMNTPEDALHTTEAGISYSVTAWDTATSLLYISGNYYFRVDRREVTLPAQASSNVTLGYETNLPSNRIAWSWNIPQQAPTTFKDEQVVSGNTLKGTLTFTTENNDRGKQLVDQLNFRAGDITGAISIVQHFIRMDYRMDCSSVVLYGSYMIDSIPNRMQNYIELDLKNIDPEAIGLTWQIQTDILNNLSFSGTGKFTGTEQHITLYADTIRNAQGQPQGWTTGKPTFTLTANNTVSDTDHSQGPTCNVTVTIGFKQKRLMCVGYNRYGGNYGYGAQESSSNLFLTSVNNFSLDNPNNYTDPEPFPVDGLNIAYKASGLWIANDGKAHQELTTPPYPDIVIVGDATFQDATVAKAMVDYVNKGGVLILMIDANNPSLTAGNSTAYTGLMYKIFEDTGIDFDAKAALTVCAPTNGAQSYTGPDVDEMATIDDPIVTGELGGKHYNPSVAGLKFGTDYLDGARLDIKPGHENDFVIYASYNGKPIFVRSKKKNIVWIGDGGFLSNSTANPYTNNGYGVSTSCPYAIDKNCRPQPRVDWGYSLPHISVYNSYIFRNIMAWAIYQAEYHGINSGGLDPFVQN